MKTLIKNAILLDMVGEEPNIRKKDILINEDTIEKIANNITEKCDKIIDAKEKI